MYYEISVPQHIANYGISVEEGGKMSAGSIGASIKGYLDDNGIKYGFIADKANIPQPIMSNVLSGNREIKVLEYYRICKILQVPFETFIEEEGE